MSKDKINLVYEVESDILQHSKLAKLSYRRDAAYLTGRAGLVRLANLVLSAASVGFMMTGYHPSTLKGYANADLIRMMNPGGKTAKFTGYKVSYLTYVSIGLGSCTAAITLLNLILLYIFMEVRCDLLWEKINQKAQVLACILSILAAFADVMSIQQIQEMNCRTLKCAYDKHKTSISHYEEEFYPPYFIYHYSAFVGFLTNAMLHSIASRIWLRNED